MSLKILLLSHGFYPAVGGIETITEFLAYSFVNNGHDVHLVTWSKDKAKKNFPFKVIRAPNLFQLFREHHWAEIVFENNPVLRLAWPAIFFNRPLVISLHTWISQKENTVSFPERLKFKWLKRAQSVISCSEAIKRRCWPSSIVIENPYQEDTFKVLKNVQKTADFVFLGRLVSDKGADLAIRAFHRLITTQEIRHLSSNLLLTIVGNGPEREYLEKLAVELHLQKEIVFKGAMHGEALVRCLNQHRFLLVPSIWEEPFGIVALEGIACGCIPIVSDGGGLPDAIGNAGLVFRRGNIEAMVECIQKVLQNPGLEQLLREAAPKHLEAHHQDIVAGKYLEVIKAAVKNKS